MASELTSAVEFATTYCSIFHGKSFAQKGTVELVDSGQKTWDKIQKEKEKKKWTSCWIEYPVIT
jgi:hypothetical protein